MTPLEVRHDRFDLSVRYGIENSYPAINGGRTYIETSTRQASAQTSGPRLVPGSASPERLATVADHRSA
jgi:hypothetical protein